MTSLLPPAARAASRRIRYVRECTKAFPVENVELILIARDWDVTNRDAQDKAARDELGSYYDWYAKHSAAQWWIDEGSNSAGLAIYRMAPSEVRPGTSGEWIVNEPHPDTQVDMVSDVMQAEWCVLIDSRGAGFKPQVQYRGLDRMEASASLRKAADAVEHERD